MDEPSSKSETSEQAAALSRLGASKGGQARAEKLSPQKRKEIAERAAAARWGAVATAGHIGQLVIGDIVVDCAVIDDGTRVINQQTMQTAFGRTGGARRGVGASRLPLLSPINIQPFITPDLRAMAEKPVSYRMPNGGRALGYPAEILPLVCEVYLEARETPGVLTRNQLPVARAAEILIRGLARVGIIALIDEATGYQEVRARHELEQILERYIQAELRPWVKMFPDEFFKEIYRLQGWEYKPGTSKRTPYVGRLVNKYVYEQLPPGVLEEMQRLNPRNERGNRVHRHHQFLTADTGNPHLDKQISTVTTLMRVARNKQEFEDLFERAFPPVNPRLPLIVVSKPEPDGNELTEAS